MSRVTKRRTWMQVLMDALPAIVLLIAGASFTAGVPGLLEVASWTGLSGAWRATAPVLLDVGLVAFAWTAVKRHVAGDETSHERRWLRILTAASVISQVLHVATLYDAISIQAVWGAIFSALFPLTVFATSETLLRLGLSKELRNADRREAREHERAAAPAPDGRTPTQAAGAPVRSIAPAPTAEETTRPAKASVAATDASPSRLEAKILELYAQGDVSKREIARRVAHLSPTGSCSESKVRTVIKRAEEAAA